MPEAQEIKSNLKRSVEDYDLDLPTPVVKDPLPYDESNVHAELLEEEQRLFEENYRARAKNRWEGQERWMGKENEEKRLVNILHPHQVFERLKSAGIAASIEPAAARVWDIDHKTGLQVLKTKEIATARLWLHDKAIRGLCGISAWVWQDGERKPQFITSLQYPYGPEWSIMRFDEFDVPTVEKYRGWRTAMLKLIVDGILTEAEVERAFGPVTNDDVADLWRAQLEEWREHHREPR